MAALTRSGARKASEIVMLTFRTLQSSRLAMLSVVAADRRLALRANGVLGRSLRPMLRAFPNVSVVHVAAASPPAEESHGAASMVFFAMGHEVRHWLWSSRCAFFRFFEPVGPTLFRLDLDACNVGTDEASVVNRLGWLEVLPNRSDYQRLDLSCRHTAHRSGAFGCAWRRAEDR